MAGIGNFYKEMEQQLRPADVQEIQFLLQDRPSWSKLHNYIILKLYGFVFIDPFLKICKF